MHPVSWLPSGTGSFLPGGAAPFLIVLPEQKILVSIWKQTLFPNGN